MRKTALLAMAVVAAVMLLVVSSQNVQAQARTPDQEVDSLIEKIKAARANEDQPSTSETKKGPSLTAPGETKAKDVKADPKKAVPAKRERTAPPFIANPNDLRKSIAEPPRLTALDVLNPPGAKSESDKLLERIRGGRSDVADKEKARRQKAEKDGITQESKPLELRSPSTTPTEVGPSHEYYTPLRRVKDVIGGDVLSGMGEKKAASPGVGETPANRAPSELPDPAKDPDAYQKRLKSDFGASADLPKYADQGLLRTYEIDRYKALLESEREVRIEGPQSLSSVYDAYRAFQGLPPPDRSLGRQDTYIPNSSNFLNPTYRGTIYEQPYSADPAQRNFANSTQSKFSNNAYYNLNTQDAFNNYRSKEYGFQGNGPRTYSTQVFDVNTMKQWASDLRSSYGMNVRPGDMTYGDMYRLRTSGTTKGGR